MVTSQATIFCIFTVIGGIIALIFDIFRILRKSFKTSNIGTYIEDILFWIITGIIILYSIFKFNNGEIRFYMFLAIILGATFYMLAFSKLIVKSSVFVIIKIKTTLNYILQIIIKPFKIIYKVLIKPIISKIINPIRQNFEKFIKKIRIKRENV